MSEVILIVSAAALTLFLLFIISTYRKGARSGAQPHPKHISLVEQLSKDELEIAYSETLTGITLAGEWRWSASRILAEIEIALSLYVQLMQVSGKPITLGGKGKRRKGLAKAAKVVIAITPDGGAGFLERFAIFKPFQVEQSIDEIPDRTTLENAMIQMKRALE